MRLILLVGMNKTGSSSIQSALCLNKLIFQKNGFFIPDSAYDERMIRGEITPGNGVELARLLARRKKRKIYEYLSQIISEARRRNCNTIVLSNEVLIRIYSNQELLDLAGACFSELRLEVYNLCIHRNIYTHALSLYKHRAKNGKYYDYRHWVESDYETLFCMQKFLSNDLPNGWNWHHVSFEYGVEEIFKRYFQELGVVGETKWPTKKVNSSLSLGELRLVASLECQFTGIAQEMFRYLQTDIKVRQDDAFELERFYSIMDDFFDKKKETLDKWSNLLHADSRQQLLERPICNLSFDNAVLEVPRGFEKALSRAFHAYSNNRFKRVLKSFYSLLYRFWMDELGFRGYDKHEFGGSL